MFETTSGRTGAASSRERALQMIFNISQIDPVEAEALEQVLRSARRQESHARLCLAIFEDVLLCVYKYRRARVQKHRDAYADAVAWLQDDDTNWPFSFRVVCETLGIEPEAVRKQLLDAYGPKHAHRSFRGTKRIVIFPLNIQRSAA